MNMIDLAANIQLPPIPAKRYFTIGEVSELCGVKPHVLRYWEQEFTQLKPVKRRGNRRYYQHHEVLLIRRIRELLYEQGFTISGARHRLDVTGIKEPNDVAKNESVKAQPDNSLVNEESIPDAYESLNFNALKSELLDILNLLRTDVHAV